MGIGSVTSMNSMTGMQAVSASAADPKIKRIQNEITETKQLLRQLSSEDELTALEKADEQKQLKREISSLNTKLEQQQEEFLRLQEREAMLSKLREAQDPSKKDDGEDRTQTANTSADTAQKEDAPAGSQPSQALQPGTVVAQSSDGTVILKEVLKQAESAGEKPENESAGKPVEETGDTEEKPADADEKPALSDREIHAMVSSDTSRRQADRIGSLVAKTADGIAVLKGEIKLDEYRGTDTERKQAELVKMQERKERESDFQLSLLGKANQAMKSAAEPDSSAKTAAQADDEKAFQVSGLSVQPEDHAAQQGFGVAIGY